MAVLRQNCTYRYYTKNRPVLRNLPTWLQCERYEALKDLTQNYEHWSQKKKKKEKKIHEAESFLRTYYYTQLLKKSLAFYGTRRFITVFTRAHHRSLPWAEWTHSTPSNPISARSILLLSHQCPGLPSGLFPLGFPIKTLYAETS
jgi:hypothetical protein